MVRLRGERGRRGDGDEEGGNGEVLEKMVTNGRNRVVVRRRKERVKWAAG